MNDKSSGYLNPYLVGIVLGLVLFGSFLLFGHGLGASGGVALISGKVVDTVAPGHTGTNAYLVNLIKGKDNPLDAWLVWEIIGVVLGGLVSGLLAGRVKMETFRGPRISARTRWIFALTGGTITGFAVRLSRGCTSGQALSGGAVLSAGSWAFMLSVFAGAYLLAWFVRRQWT